MDEQGQAPGAVDPRADKKPLSGSVPLERALPLPSRAVLHRRTEAEHHRLVPARFDRRRPSRHFVAGHPPRRIALESKRQKNRANRPAPVDIPPAGRLDGSAGFLFLRRTGHQAESALHPGHEPRRLHALHQCPQIGISGNRRAISISHRKNFKMGIPCFSGIQKRVFHLSA